MALAACATVKERTDTYLAADASTLDRPIQAWLRNLEIVSDDIPLTSDYPMLRDSLTAVASRHGIAMANPAAGQGYAVDFVVHERSYVVDLVTSHSVMAVMNVGPNRDGSPSAARVVYAAVAPDSVQSFYQIMAIAEKVFGSLEKTLDDEDARHKAAAQAAAQAKGTAAAHPPAPESAPAP